MTTCLCCSGTCGCATRGCCSEGMQHVRQKFRASIGRHCTLYIIVGGLAGCLYDPLVLVNFACLRQPGNPHPKPCARG